MSPSPSKKKKKGACDGKNQGRRSGPDREEGKKREPPNGSVQRTKRTTFPPEKKKDRTRRMRVTNPLHPPAKGVQK